MKLVNLTGQPFSLYDTEGAVVDIDPDPRYVGLVAVGDHEVIDDEEGRAYSLNVRRVRAVKGMPERDAGTVYVVPIEVAMVLQEDRDDVVYLAEEVDVRTVDGRRRRISHLRRTVRARIAEMRH